MKCLILAAGYATRLYPLTENFPKPLLEIKGKTILDWLVDDIDTLGVVDEYVVISNHKYAEHFRTWAEKKAQRVTVLDDGTDSNENRLGAVRDVQFAIDKLEVSDDVLVIAGDNVLDFSLTSFVKYAMAKNASCIMRYHEPNRARLSKSGVVVFGDDDRVLLMQEKPAEPKSEWCAPPFYYYTAEDAALVREAIADGCGIDAPGSYISWLCSRSPVYAMQMPGSRYDIGTVESYEKVKEIYKGIGQG
ncbi:MAG: nucleotidyltransferase family protein [Clostridia bacterium]|nr:nucleotidyltransferase family protein [Clostridia bacterium]